MDSGVKSKRAYFIESIQKEVFSVQEGWLLKFRENTKKFRRLQKIDQTCHTGSQPLEGSPGYVWRNVNRPVSML